MRLGRIPRNGLETVFTADGIFEQSLQQAKRKATFAWKVNFLCNLGHRGRSTLPPRNPRLDFEEAYVVL
jgi:hypothetical protein